MLKQEGEDAEKTGRIYVREMGLVVETMRSNCRENRDESWRKRKNAENTWFAGISCREKWDEIVEENGRWRKAKGKYWCFAV